MSNRNDESAGRQEDYGRYGVARDRQDQGRYGAQGGEQRSWGDNSYSDYQQPRPQGAYGSISHGASNQAGGGGFSGGAAGGYGGFGGHGAQGGQGGYGPLYQGSSYAQDSSSFSRSSGPYDDRGGRGGYSQQQGEERYSSFSAGDPQRDPGGGYGDRGGAFTGQGGYSWDRDSGRGQGGGAYGQNDYSHAAQRSHWRTDQGPGQNRFQDQGFSQGQPARDPYAQGDFSPSSEHPHDPHYRQWRDQQLSGHDRDYAHWREQQAQRYDNDYKSWRDERHQAFSKDFDGWRSSRSAQASKGAGGQSPSDLQAGGSSVAEAGQAAVEDVTDGGTGRHDEKERRDEKH